MRTSFPLAFIIFILFFSTHSNGFSVDLIPRDSPKSPLFNSSWSHFDRLARALTRSQNRHNHFTSSVDSIAAVGSPTSPLISTGGEFLMKISLGTPPVSILAIADTGSDLVWTQCSPCQYCYKQKAPLFDPTKSSTYKRVPCESSACSVDTRGACTNRGCEYWMSYGDSSYSEGILSNETVVLGSSASNAVTHEELVFGCGFNNAGTFMSTETGIVGLGGGDSSLIAQLDEVIDGKFSYCLVPNFNLKSSVMHFGDDATVVSGVETPIITRIPKTFYYLTLEGLTVGNGPRFDIRDYEYTEVESAGTGNIIIDSGTTLTYLPQELYSKLVEEVKSVVQLTPTDDPLRLLEVCYATTTSMEGLPDITAHFTGADVKLLPLNSFVETAAGVACLAFRPAGSVAIYGNIAQMNFLVGYDLKEKTVSFKPTECGK